ncbi:translation elongation factor Ts [Candidatus Nomurabacteria bacterium]|nr:translation elongation factor Ts [Candidatus Nomurabacteria bacterium]
MITTEQIKELREKTGISIAECKKALEATEGDMAKAMDILRERAAAAVGKKADRDLGAGSVASYVHGTAQVGAMVKLACETDFVSKNEEFVALARDIAMHATAMKPTSIVELLEQPFIKNPESMIKDLISAATQKFGERIEVSELSVFSV